MEYLVVRACQAEVATVDLCSSEIRGQASLGRGNARGHPHGFEGGARGLLHRKLSRSARDSGAASGLMFSHETTTKSETPGITKATEYRVKSRTMSLISRDHHLQIIERAILVLCTMTSLRQMELYLSFEQKQVIILDGGLRENAFSIASPPVTGPSSFNANDAPTFQGYPRLTSYSSPTPSFLHRMI